VRDFTATSFPLSKLRGEGDTAPTFSGLHVYLQFTWEVGLPPSPVEFSSHCCFYKLSRSWLLSVCYCSCLLQLVSCEGFPLSPRRYSGLPSLFAMCLFFVIAYYSVFFFFPWWWSDCSGGYTDLAQDCLWEYQVLLSSSCGLLLPKLLGTDVWWHRGSPPCFSI
jgi:hypothetical protein